MGVDIVSIETWVDEEFAKLAAKYWVLAVNRCSDALDPPLAKLTLVILRQFELCGIPVVNGSQAYSLLFSKAGHHAAVKLAGLQTPKSVFLNGLNKTFDAEAVALPPDMKFPLLYKPCAAAYAQGVVSLTNFSDLEDFLKKPELGNDGSGFLQELKNPDAGEYFRVFVLNGKMQCAIRVVPRVVRQSETSTEVPASQDDNNTSSTTTGGTSTSTITSTCACSANKSGTSPLRFLAYEPTEEESEEAIRILAATAGADCGSVEFMRCKGERFYFDVNLLSHLPVRGDGSSAESRFVGFEDPDGIWTDRNFYAEMADLCRSRLIKL